MDRELGLDGWPATGGGRRRRLARVGVQHNPGTLPRLFGRAVDAFSTARCGSVDIPNALATTWLYITEDSRRPLKDEVRQLELFQERVAPLVNAAG